MVQAQLERDSVSISQHLKPETQTLAYRKQEPYQRWIMSFRLVFKALTKTPILSSNIQKANNCGGYQDLQGGWTSTAARTTEISCVWRFDTNERQAINKHLEKQQGIMPKSDKLHELWEMAICISQQWQWPVSSTSRSRWPSISLPSYPFGQRFHCLSLGYTTLYKGCGEFPC